MALSELLTAPALEALLRDGTLAGAWTLDADRSEVILKTRHSWGLRPLQGVFRQVSGHGTVNAAGGVSGAVTIAAGSLDTSNQRRDKHLRSADFFDVGNHPNFTFAADSVGPAGDGVRVTGNLTVRGRTRAVTFDAKVSVAQDAVELDGDIPVNRADYGLTWNFFGIAAMDNIIAVRAVFTRDRAAA
jgi:polyisoprenoid-binding protein YceI